MKTQKTSGKGSKVPCKLPKDQFAPTPAKPIPQHKRMAGC